MGVVSVALLAGVQMVTDGLAVLSVQARADLAASETKEKMSADNRVRRKIL
jgi:hypothetical protein